MTADARLTELLGDHPPLNAWQQQLLDAIQSGRPIVLNIPRRAGRSAITEWASAVPAPAPPRPQAVPNGTSACPDGCCVETEDPTLPRRSDQDLYSRPMFQVLLDDSAGSQVDLDEELPNGSGHVMHVPASEYDRPDRIFL